MTLLDIYKPIRKISYPLTSFIIIAVLAFFFLYRNFSINHLLSVASVALILLFVWLRLRPGRTKIHDSKLVFKAIGNGRPTFVNIYSNY